MSTQTQSVPTSTSGPPSLATNAEEGFNINQGSEFLRPIGDIYKEKDLTLIGVTCMFLVLCLACVGGRVLARRRVKLGLEADDYLAVVALMMFIGTAIEQILIAVHNDNSNLEPGKLELASQLTYNFSITTARASILMLYRRIFSLRVMWFRIAWWVNAGLVIGYCITLLADLLHQCGPYPVSELWRSPATCFDTSGGVAGPTSMGFLNAILDTCILVLPIRMVWSLQMSNKQKFGVSGIFALGSIGVLISIARAVIVANPHFDNGVSFIIWSTAESAVALICACLPILRPLFTTCFVRSPRVPNNGTTGSMTFPTIAISPSCIDHSQDEGNVSYSMFRQEFDSGYRVNDMKANVVMDEHKFRDA